MPHLNKMNREEVRHHMTHFLSDAALSTVEAAKQYLIQLRSTVIDGFTLTESRSLWFSLLLYKFRQENNVTDELYAAARGFLLESISSQSSDGTAARRYLEVFHSWKKEDHRSFVNEVIGYYLEVLHLKQTIEETKEEATIAEWQGSYHKLIQTIRDAADRMGFLAALDERVAEVHHMRHSLVEETMKRAYWDMMEEDIRNKNHSTVLAQLVELKGMIREIIPSAFHADLHEKFDMEYIQNHLQKETLDPDYLVQLCRWVIESMKEWDAASAAPLYVREIQTWEQAIGTLEWPQFLRFSLELCTLLALDAKTRIGIWRSLLRNS
jgi:hypothetical protein